ncbi:hypothetical protein J3Q64DRAFT_1711198 [Phycomyces blakesleeanus]|uniref:Transmembrane protein n=2 Tax=Phycomyces blakesleeanus TaxID=4837 RepID=A0A167KQZ2_PHYB8|nr:hypothetical protein PHYBLDRAFT_188637 [Phycomyces blakesleeanus NRRL 1555(-)]OAD68669.1 hypothetical protein PHYBLDRAFT_188637 [Phycomyces blakesleeanus NRRL 1555(-)]|eukprot:XP_018286709.1 hypothetical protein PHYBLDRAFT_188637 [Phycomyces blakesleeanus NRRL 1555(-)]
MTVSKTEIKQQLATYVPNEKERLVIRSAMFSLITFATVGAASLGMSARMWSKSRTPVGKRSGIPTILGFFTGLTLGGALGMNKGMQTLRASLPSDSGLLTLIHEHDEIKQQEINQALLQNSDDTISSGLSIDNDNDPLPTLDILESPVASNDTLLLAAPSDE